ncbi:peptidoglycan DD-metalloendopeptidase family protein [Litchfieldella rifensis]|uniref:Peptidoglycan DD-metalloendopeptidase family protein n=1 Tax=Litchfieldella rifensis TaxID=762643 RepID=A0ABV7LJ18_9GAMM
MLRILHSLPRTHKLLLLPVATMVTVLGTQKIFSAFDENASVDDSPTVLVPLDLDTSTSDTPTASDKSPIAEAVQLASNAPNPTRQHVPLSELTATEVLDIDFVSSANANEESQGPVDSTARAPATDAQTTAPGIAPRIDNNILHLAMMLPDESTQEDDTSHDEEGGTSYEDFSADPLFLFDEEHVFLDEEIVAQQTYTPEWQTYTVQPGDTFAVMAERNLGLGYSEVMQLLDNLPDESVLTRLRVGHSFDYRLNEDDQLLALRIMKNARNGYLIERGDDQDFEVTSIEKSGEPTQRLFAGTVNGSFGRSAEATGLSAAEVAQLSSLLSKKLDFRRDTRRGDRFHVLVEYDVIDGQNLDAHILAVQYEGARMDLTVVRNSADDRFYTPEGQSLDPAFDRYPFEGSYRLSSSFNLKRRHPITGRVSPHYGTDFAMPPGSPVIAPAAGRVEKVGNHPLAGRFVVVRHDNGYQTRYLHLSRPLVNRGERVSMGERIALSGNTGRSTGPHLHYEVIVNNNQVDPMRVELPENQSLEGDALVTFQRESERLLATLESGETGTVVASTGNREPRGDGS